MDSRNGSVAKSLCRGEHEFLARLAQGEDIPGPSHGTRCFFRWTTPMMEASMDWNLGWHQGRCSFWHTFGRTRNFLQNLIWFGIVQNLLSAVRTQARLSAVAMGEGPRGPAILEKDNLVETLRRCTNSSVRPSHRTWLLQPRMVLANCGFAAYGLFFSAMARSSLCQVRNRG